jgi:hypothetical protein
MPDILDDAVKSIMKKDPGMSKDSAYGIAVSTLQKSGDLKKGTYESTEKGKRRAEMSKATRAKTRAKKYKTERKMGRKEERNTSGRN